MTDVATFPDTEAILVGILSPMFPGIRFATMMPADIDSTVVRIHRISGANRDIYADRPIVDVDVFAADDATASLAARQIQAKILSLAGTTGLGGSGVISLVTTVNGPRWLPEANQNITRYGATYEIKIRS
jgi:hypothetical protein